MKTHITLCTLVLLTSATGAALASTADFEDLSLASDSYYNGSDLAGGFASHGVFFPTNYSTAYGSWDNFAYSNIVDTTTAGFGNQYASYAGGGLGGSGNYAVAYPSFATGSAQFNLPGGQTVQSVYVTNTTYSALDMLSGSGFSKQFGGISGDDPDWFTLTFTGYTGLNATGSITDSVVFYLADFRFADNTQDYIVQDWTLVDLTPLGDAASVSLTWASSDSGAFGINTPTYTALDNLTTVPEPASLALLAVGGLSLAARRRNRRFA